MIYDIIVLENFHFNPSTHKREAGFFKNLHSGERFCKDAFLTEYIRVDCRTNRKKIIRQFKQNRYKRAQGLDGAVLALVVHKVDNAIHWINH